VLRTAAAPQPPANTETYPSAIAEWQLGADKFWKWASKYCPDAKYMNVKSDIQIRQLLFGGIENRYCLS
jgi:DNA polymerase-1